MRKETRAALASINREFYARRADAFDATRQAPWQGWTRIVDHLERRGRHRRHSILDLGCGNGRLGAYLESRLAGGFEYTGLDASLRLLACARGAVRRPALLLADCIEESLPLAAARGFDLVAAFGLLHHVPSWRRRRELLFELADHLAVGGILAVSFWRFDADERFGARLVSWDEHNRGASAPVATDDLEPGDFLLRWGEGKSRRYCHLADAVEAAELTGGLGLRRLDTFTADGAGGRLNLYHLLVNEGGGRSRR